jgi:hypothetical protein
VSRPGHRWLAHARVDSCRRLMPASRIARRPPTDGVTTADTDPRSVTGRFELTEVRHGRVAKDAAAWFMILRTEKWVIDTVSPARRSSQTRPSVWRPADLDGSALGCRWQAAKRCGSDCPALDEHRRTSRSSRRSFMRPGGRRMRGRPEVQSVARRAAGPRRAWRGALIQKR